MIQTGHLSHRERRALHWQRNLMVGCSAHWLLQEHRDADCTVWNPELDCHGPLTTNDVSVSSLIFYMDLSRPVRTYFWPLMLRVTKVTIIAPGAGIPELQNQIILDSGQL